MKKYIYFFTFILLLGQLKYSSAAHSETPVYTQTSPLNILTAFTRDEVDNMTQRTVIPKLSDDTLERLISTLTAWLDVKKLTTFCHTQDYDEDDLRKKIEREQQQLNALQAERTHRNTEPQTSMGRRIDSNYPTTEAPAEQS